MPETWQSMGIKLAQHLKQLITKENLSNKSSKAQPELVVETFLMTNKIIPSELTIEKRTPADRSEPDIECRLASVS